MISVSGAVEATATNGAAIALAPGGWLCPGDTLRTSGDGRLALRMPATQTVIRLNRNSELRLRPASDPTPGVGLTRGLLHFLSSTRVFFSIDTPLVTAGIDGTEAVVHVLPALGAAVSVREGRVTATGGGASTPVAGGQTAFAPPGGPVRPVGAADADALPAPFRAYVLNPEGAVDWAIHYPAPALDPLREAPPAALAALADGDLDAAEAALDCRPGAPSPTAELCLLVAVGRNDAEAAAARLASPPPAPGAPWLIASSYARQARGDLRAAEADAEAAVALAPADRLTRARAAELRLLRGDASGALDILEAQTPCDPIPFVNAVAGFALLSQQDLDAARVRLDCALEGDGDEPLGWLGRGLLRIREGDVAGGRADLEAAAALAPRQASLRVWLGRAYYEEGRDDKAAAQYELARAEDPDSPLPYLFAALQRYADNDPVGALRALRAAERRGAARAPVRDRRGLDEDAAQRGAALAQTYRSLGQDDAAVASAGQAVAADPTSAGAHRFLARALTPRSGYEVARSSQTLVADLLSGPTNAPIRPQDGEVNLGLLDGLGELRPSFREYSAFFRQPGFAGEFAGEAGTQDTYGDTASAAYDGGRWSAALGQFHFQNDGFGPNNDVRDEILVGQLRASAAPWLDLFGEYRFLESERGVINDRLLTPVRPSTRFAQEDHRARLGAHARMGPDLDLLALAVWRSVDARVLSPLGATRNQEDGGQVQLRGDWRPTDDLTLTFGGEVGASDAETATPFFGTTDLESSQATLYAYLSWAAADWLDVEGGLSFDSYVEDPAGPGRLNQEEISPRFGLVLRPVETLSLRAAWFQGIKKRLIFDQQLEPTQFAGFNQSFQDYNGAEYDAFGLGAEWTPLDELSLGAEWVTRSIETPIQLSGAFVPQPWEEERFRAWISGVIGESLSVNLAAERIDQERRGLLTESLESWTFPATVAWHDPSGLFAMARLTFYQQQAGRTAAGIASQESVAGHVLDASIGWRFSDRPVVVSLDALNLTDQDVRFQEPVYRVEDPGLRRFSAGLAVMGRLAVRF
ncbi:TonB-dependent receptor [Albimonas sp. CAU 1670]|uniref:FecR domain-containing protein n=1 Tax=Albimonas sp. CAU 1670 TaxID=3032599 RepID=UPI0023DB6D06|nr:FecR domain-containing protein [Albimonas sp. CAU 1670]MDF2235299.1 TonB-dependent receptor [Albimonas sp. CAU 1670]